MRLHKNSFGLASIASLLLIAGLALAEDAPAPTPDEPAICKQNPAKCEQQRERMKKRQAAFKAECAAQPDQCEEMKQARRERFMQRSGGGNPGGGELPAE